MTALPASIFEVKIGGEIFGRAERLQVTRDLKEITGSFEIDLVDVGRLQDANIGGLGVMRLESAITQRKPVTISIDDEAVLVGYIWDVDLEEDGGHFKARLLGYDRTGDLRDCSGAPTGPAEFKGLTLTQFAEAICKPFGISVRAEVDVGEPFPRIAVNPHETALQMLEKASRQRSVLLVSDGVGGLLLTRGGSSRAPGPILRGDNIIGIKGRLSWRHRFSDVYVKGQSERGAGHRRAKGAKAALDSSVQPFNGVGVAVPAVPLASSPAATAARSNAAAGTLMTGHATDPEINRYRPHVRLTRTQSGMSTTQEQAEWAVRVARGEGNDLHYRVPHCRIGKQNTLWRPNQVADVYDPYCGINGDMLIAGVQFTLAEGQEPHTMLRVVGQGTYDRINEAARKRPAHEGHGRARRRHAAAGPLDSSVIALPPVEVVATKP